MPPIVALLFGYGLAFWLIRSDMRHRDLRSPALWIPGVLVLVSGSRPVSYWVEMLGFSSGAETNAESSPANLLLLLLLLVSALVVLARRNFNWGVAIRQNRALFVMYAFFFVSSLWSPDPMVTVRRIVKDTGTLYIALVILTNPNPWRAARATFVRASYFLFPLSLVTAKYYPTIGRYASKSGDSLYTGLTTQKNTLGLVALLCLFFLIWDLMELPNEVAARDLKMAKRQRYIAIGIGFVLLLMAQSATSQICLMIGCTILFGVKKLAKKPTGARQFVMILCVLVVLVAADKTFGVANAIAEAFGRNMTLTGRTDIWRVALSHQIHPILGFGYNAFWDLPVVNQIYEELGDFIHIRTVHNGYIEMYIDGGFVGITFLAMFLAGTGFYCFRRAFKIAPLMAAPLALWFVTIVYNNSETSFFRSDLLWFTFLLITTEVPMRRVVAAVAGRAVPPRAVPVPREAPRPGPPAHSDV